MKKVICVLLSVILSLCVFFFSSCEKTDKDEAGSSENIADMAQNGAVAEPDGTTGIDTTSEENVLSDLSVIPDFSLVADKTEVAPGETVVVKFHVKNAVHLASITSELEYYDAVLTVNEYEAYSDSDFYDMSNVHDSVVDFKGFVLTTISLEDADLLTVTFTVSENAVSGSEAVLNLNISELTIGDDETGNSCQRYEDYIQPVSLTLKIK